jgi:hypothetical protein
MQKSSADWKELYMLEKNRLMNMPFVLSIQCAIHLTPKIPWDQKLVDCCLGSLCEEKKKI